MVGRQVELTVDRVLWTRDQPAQSLPERLVLPAAGWLKKDEALVPVAYETEPRLDVGHTYVIALVWTPRLCSPGDGELAAHWAGLGRRSCHPVR